ncbi:hypothetical protein [Vibrio pectenicida]|uniref:Uncharacterized protein n=1 Tax=Vibrio pectenicida TaxID=62763 RepID=A0A3R9G1X2_9VIBR|nr:hypothetical protein [Vibrio pectenicida]RSD30405.1 hypothetical protein EJA03_14190 [Vibrio pectenicida]
MPILQFVEATALWSGFGPIQSIMFIVELNQQQNTDITTDYSIDLLNSVHSATSRFFVSG